MKIIESYNFGRESVSDFLVADNIKSEAYAKVMCDALQAKYGGIHARGYFQVKPDDYRLCIPVRNRRRESSGDVPTPPEGKDGLPIPASLDPLRRAY